MNPISLAIGDKLALLAFDVFKEKLDPLTENSRWSGFSPRWTLPAKLRNINNPDKNNTAVLIILDSAREVELGVAPFFPKTTIGKDEMITSRTAMKDLNGDN